MNKKQLISKIAESENITLAKAKSFLDSFAGIVTKALSEGESVSIHTLGKFEVRDRSERNMYNPRSKKRYIIKAHKIPFFKSYAALKKSVK